MKHFLIVTSIILFVSLPFLFPSIENAQDGSFNDYEYLQKLRRSHTVVNNDDKSKGWQDNGIFNSWYQPGNGSENDKALNNLKSTTPTPTSNVPTHANTPISPTQKTVKNEGTDSSKSKVQTRVETKGETKNLLPYLLFVLLIVLVILILYLKYNY